MQLVTIPTAPIRPFSELLAEDLLASLNVELTKRVDAHKAFYTKFWDSPITPDAVLVALGPLAPVLLGAASESIDHIGRLAALVGKTILDFAPAEMWQPRRAFVLTNGVVTLEPPAVGHDAWGKLIPVEPEPIIDEETEAVEP